MNSPASPAPCDTAGPEVHEVLVLNESVGGDHGTLTGRGLGEDGTVVTGTHLQGFAAPRLACRCGNLLVVGIDIGMKARRTRDSPNFERGVSRMGLSRVSLKV